MMKAGVELAGEVGDQMKKGWDLMKKKGLPMLSRFAQSTKSKVVSMTKEVSDQVQSKMKSGEKKKGESEKKKGDEKKKLRRANKVVESDSESNSESDEKPAKKSESEDSESSENENEVAYL